MSSILDALKKLEEEKAARQAEEHAADMPFRPEKAEAELICAARPAQPASSRKIILGAFAVGTVLIILCVALSVYIASKVLSPAPPVTNAARPEPQPPAVVHETTPVAPAEDRPVPNIQKAQAAPEPPAKTPPEPKATPPVEKIKAPAVKAETAKIQLAKTPETTVPEPPAPVAASPKKVKVIVDKTPPQPTAPVVEAAPTPKTTSPATAPSREDLRKLPLLRPSDRTKFNLEGLQLNLLSEPGAGRRYGSAVINLNKVFVGDKIPGTRATLIGVWNDGVAIEIQDSGSRFFVLR